MMQEAKEHAGLVAVQSPSISGSLSSGKDKKRRRSSSRKRSKRLVNRNGGASPPPASTNQRRFRASKETRAKFKSVIHRLVTINRFQREALQQQAAAMADGSASGKGGLGSEKSSRLARATSGAMSMSAAKAMDSYIKEQSDIYAYAEQRNVAEDEEHLPFLIIHPEATLKVAWDLLLLGLVIFFGFSVPYRLGFDI